MAEKKAQSPKREDLLARGYRVPEQNYTAKHPADDPTGGPELQTIEDDRSSSKAKSGPAENKSAGKGK